MKKFFAAMFAALGLVLLSITPAQASVEPAAKSVTAVASSSASVVAPASIAAPGGVAKAAPQTIGSSGIKPSWLFLPSNYCYWAMNGGYYCYRYACTQFEIWFYNCYNGYYLMNPYRWV